MVRPGRYAIWLLMILILMMSPMTLLAQEETETALAPTATFTATASPTLTSTVTATATATNTATSTMTETATNTATATELATSSDTPTETLAPSPELTAELTESATEPAIEVTAELTELATEPGIETTEELTPEVTAEISLSPELTDVVNEETVITESNLYLPMTSELNIVTSSDEMSPPDINQLLSMETTLQANALIVSSNVSSTNYLEDFENAPGSFTYPTIANVASNGGSCYCDPPVSPALSSRGILARNFVAQPFGTFMWINVDVLLPEISRVTAADFDAAYDIFPITGTTLNALEIIFWDENDAIVEIKSCSYTTPSNICSIDFGDPVDNVRVVRFRHTYVGFINNSVAQMDISVDNLSLSHEPMPTGNVISVDGTGSSTTLMSNMQVNLLDNGLPLSSNGFCTITEGIHSANNGGILPVNEELFPGDENPKDCRATEFDPGLDVDATAVKLFANTYVFTDVAQLPTISGNVVIRLYDNIPAGNFATITRWDDQTVGNFRLFQILPGGGLALENIILSNGAAVFDGNPDSDNGGAILNAGELILRNSAILDSYASGQGGAIYNTGTVFMTQSCIARNTSSDNSSIHTTNNNVATPFNWWGASDGPSDLANPASGSGDFTNIGLANYSNPLPVAPPACESPPPSCDSNDIAIIRQKPFAPFRSQEAYDMHAVAQEFTIDSSHMWTDFHENRHDGLILHDGPTINARRLATLPWGLAIKVDAFIEFPQTGQNSQLWYRVLEFNKEGATYQYENGSWTIINGIENPELLALLNLAEDVWINARMENNFYVEGVNASLNPCNGDISNITGSITETITFSYDRQAAARYAIAHAYRNSHPSSETNQEYPIWYNSQNQFRVTNNITTCLELGIPNCPDSSFIAGASSQFIFIPYIDRIPFAPFLYADVTGAGGATGSAVFNSESIWIGGLPWTFNVSSTGLVDTLTECGVVPPSPSEVTGWRYCPEEYNAVADPIVGYASSGWDNHTALTQYYSKQNWGSNYDNYVIGSQRGIQVAVFDMYNSANQILDFANGPLCTTLIVNNPCDSTGIANGFNNLDDINIQNQFYNSFIINPGFLNNINDGSIDIVGGQRPNLLVNNLSGDIAGIFSSASSIQTGDYITVPSSDGHGFLVAGWGPISSCEVALSDNSAWLLNDGYYNFYSQQAAVGGLIPRPLYFNHSLASGTYAASVPYVVDFPGTIDRPANQPGLQLQRPKPRPFYCATYNDFATFTQSQGFALSYDQGYFQFYTFPTSAITISANVLYLPPEDWEW